MKITYRLLTIILIFYSFFIFSVKKQQHTDIPVKGYKLVWQDEFKGETLDLKKWNYIPGKRRDAYNSKEAVYLDGKGCLHIRAKKKGDSVLTAMISTQNLFETQFGYFECKAKLTKALGIWPAFWLTSPGCGVDYGTPEKNGVEIDIFEYFANNNPNAVSHNLHWGGYGVTHKELGLIYSPLKKTSDGFHTFGLEWTDTSYAAFVDGEKKVTGNTLISKVPEFIILSVECDKNVAGPLQENALPDDFIIDYVRVYKKNSGEK
jgi:beta-glucanase (GH16 family)